MTTKDFIADIRQQIAKGNVKSAIGQLQILLENSPQLDEVLLQSARHSDILKQIRQGRVDHDQSSATKNQITFGLLELLREVEEQEGKPAIQEEMRQAISIVKSKNVVVGSNITSGGNVHIGDQTIHTETKTSQRLRQFLFLLVPVLVIGGTYFWYQNQELKRPLDILILIENQTSNDQLREPIGTLTLTYGGKSIPLENIGRKAFFHNIPANFKDDIFRLQYKSEGFIPIDTSFHYTESVSLFVSRNNDLAILKGNVIDEGGRPLVDVKVSINCCSNMTTSSGDFILKIPFKDQNVNQRLRVFKDGYKLWDHTTPVKIGELVRIVLEEKRDG